jgi:hypothetical protein
MKTTPSQLLAGLSLLAVVSGSAFASDPTPVSASSSSSSPGSHATLSVFAYQPPVDTSNPAPVIAPTVALGDYAFAANDVPLRMERVQVKDSPDRLYRAFAEALAFPNMSAPCALYTRPLSHHVQLMALCGPIFPTLGESATLGEQPRFPVVGLNW